MTDDVRSHKPTRKLAAPVGRMTKLNRLADIVLLLTLLAPDQTNAETVTQSINVDVAPEVVRAAVRDNSAIDKRLLPGSVVSSTNEDGIYFLRFADGRTTRRAIPSLDGETRTLDFGAISQGPAYRSPSMYILAEGSGTRLSWASTVPDPTLTVRNAETCSPSTGCGIFREVLMRVRYG